MIKNQINQPINNNNNNNNNINNINDNKIKRQKINNDIKELKESLLNFSSLLSKELNYQEIKLKEISNDLISFNNHNNNEIEDIDIDDDEEYKEFINEEFNEKLKIFKPIYEYINQEINEINLEYKLFRNNINKHNKHNNNLSKWWFWLSSTFSISSLNQIQNYFYLFYYKILNFKKVYLKVFNFYLE